MMLTFTEPENQRWLQYYRTRLGEAIVDSFYADALRKVQAMYPGTVPASARSTVIDAFLRACREASSQKLEDLEQLQPIKTDRAEREQDLINRFHIQTFVACGDKLDQRRFHRFHLRKGRLDADIELIEELIDVETGPPTIRAFKHEAGIRISNSGASGFWPSSTRLVRKLPIDNQMVEATLNGHPGGVTASEIMRECDISRTRVLAALKRIGAAVIGRAENRGRSPVYAIRAA